MVIKNFEKLASSALRRQALLIAEAGYGAINTKKAVQDSVSFNARNNQLIVQKQKFNLSQKKKIVALGIGKVSLEAVSAICVILGEKISAGYIIDISEGKISEKIVSRAGTHPLVSGQNVDFSKELVLMLEDLTVDDLVICVISGGGSALFEIPYEILVEKQAEIFKLLTKAGANIQELNTVRKHTSLVKGGKLAKKIYPAEIINLFFSDIPGNDLGMIASGPTVKDTTSTRDALNVLHKYNTMDSLGSNVVRLIETPKEDKYFVKSSNFLLVSPKQAIMAMQARAEELGYKTQIYSENFQKDSGELAKEIISLGRPRVCLLGTGESTVKIRGSGKGGRSQETVLAALSLIGENQVLLCLASDGRDNTDAAGALVDRSTLTRSQALGINFQDYLNNNDSFTFFETVGDQVLTGLTDSNISDFFVFLNK